MTKRARKRLFYLLVLLFVLLGSGTMLYAEGWRVDPARLRPVKIGAVYVRPFPDFASVTIDEKRITKKPSLFSSGFFMNNLLPRTYTIRVEAEGYSSWSKEVRVLPALITQLKYVVLVPHKDEPVVSGGVRRFWFAGDTLAVQNAQGKIITGEKELSGDEMLAVSFRESYTITRNTASKQFFLERLDTNESVPFKSPSSHITIVPRQPNPTIAFPLQNSFHLFVFDKKTTSTQIRTENIPRLLAASKQWIAWTTWNPRRDASQVYFYNLPTRSTSTESYSFPGKIVKMQFSEREILGILQDRGDAYLINPEEGTQRVLANDVRDFIFNENGSSLAALEQNGIEVFSFTAPAEYYRLSIPNARDIKSLSWYWDNFHLFLHYPEKVMFLDLEDTSLQNLTVAAETSLSHYELLTNELYYIKNGALLRKTFPK